MKKTLIIILMLSVGMPIFAFAQINEADSAITKEERNAQFEARKEERAANIEERREKVEERKEERKEKRCERVENRIRTRVNRYENNRAQHKKVFDNVVARVEKVLARFESSGLDVSDLKTMMVELKKKIMELHTLHEEFISELEKTENHACGESEGAFKNQLGEARKMILEVREKLKEIRDYYKNTVRLEILELRDEWEEIKPDNEDGE